MESETLRAGLVHAGDHGVDLVALAETFGALVVAVPRQIGAADEGLHPAGQLHFDTAIIDLGDRGR